MNLRLYLDDCAAAKTLVRLLRERGHDVEIPVEAGLSGEDDPVHLAHSESTDRILITKDVDDFAELVNERSDYPGVLGICQDNDPARDMTYEQIVRAIDNLLQAEIELQGHLHILNHWRY